MGWQDVESKLLFWDSGTGQTWDTTHGPPVSDVSPGAQFAIVQYLQAVYNGSDTARGFLDLLGLGSDPIRIGVAADGQVAFGVHGAGASGAINYIGIDLSKVPLTYYMNDHGQLVKDLPTLTIMHELQHKYWGIIATDPFPWNADPAVVQATENTADYDHNGYPVDFQNAVAANDGLERQRAA